MYWGKSGVHLRKEEEKPAQGIIAVQNMSQAKGGEAKNVKGLVRFKGTSYLERPCDHNICYSNRVYLFCLLPQNLTASFFCWWFESIP